MLTYQLLAGVGRGCSKEVEHIPFSREVVGSNPAGCQAFLLSFTSAGGVFYQGPVTGTTVCCDRQNGMLSCATLCKTVSVTQELVKKTTCFGSNSQHPG